MGHGVAQWFGSEDMDIAPTGGLDQNLGGSSAEPTTVAMPQEEKLGDFSNSVDTLDFVL